ncbi:hypothetical protein MMB17_07020 [Methylobacterium organophilum]|uniref:hypothetical protein n=1 Tax=Methylobacterium organophilum TaxID=410 RepID=UPI001F135821|nr:hypothetical protein [Methylobacterium organophilum]UMY19042.1 hypothetical protein MMB17_07020 [Methylobacterium organophilum]
MTRNTFRWLLAGAGASLAAGLTLSPDGASARGGSFTPPGGQLAATAPGGTQGLAGPRNVSEASRGGHAYGRRERLLRVDPYGRRPAPDGFGEVPGW